MQRIFNCTAVVAAVAMAAMLLGLSGGCASVGESASRDTVTANVGNYPSPPSGVERARLGVPPFKVEADRYGFSVSDHDLEAVAADQATTLLHRTRRFNVIERTQLEQLLREQDLEGIVRPGEMARMGDVRGVDYLLIGKVTNFRVKVDRQAEEMGVRSGLVSRKLLGGFTGGVDQKQTRISTEAGIDIRLVDPSTGEVAVAHFSQFRHEDSAGGFGIDIAGVGGSGDADVRIEADDAGKLLRLAFDDAIRKMLPEIDEMLLARVNQNVVDSPSVTVDPATPQQLEQQQQQLQQHTK